ncbi:MAG TPA: glutathione S-transferase family protein [Polyangia bacterium]
MGSQNLILYYHPLASFCHKVLLALYESETPFEGRVVDLADEASSAEMLAFWPVGKIPVLRDERRATTVPETSIIIEYLQTFHPGPTRLVPVEPEAALQTRLWDRFFDLYISAPMQKIVTDRLRPEGKSDPVGVEEAFATLQRAYDLLEKHLGERGNGWAAGGSFDLADCAAALFYAGIVAPFAATHPRIAAYFERLLARPSMTRVLHEARPYFPLFPLRDQIPRRFLGPSVP